MESSGIEQDVVKTEENQSPEFDVIKDKSDEDENENE